MIQLNATVIKMLNWINQPFNKKLVEKELKI
jgi:hypothetical protein